MDIRVLILFLVSIVMQDTRSMTFFSKRYLASGQQQMFEVRSAFAKGCFLGEPMSIFCTDKLRRSCVGRRKTTREGGGVHDTECFQTSAQHDMFIVFDFFAVLPYPAKRGTIGEGHLCNLLTTRRLANVTDITNCSICCVSRIPRVCGAVRWSRTEQSRCGRWHTQNQC